jgi:predicted solute-binding protein
VDVEAGDDPRDAGCDAWLRIGDPALRECFDPTTPTAFCPSEAWKEITHTAFPFAVWIVREGVDISNHLDAFWRSRERGAAALNSLVQMGAETWDLDPAFVHRYLAEESLYSLGDRLPETLRELRDRAARLGLCEGTFDPRPVEPLRTEGVLS